MCLSLLPASAFAESESEEEAPLYPVKFISAPEGAAVTVFNGEGEAEEAGEDGNWLLPEGTYTYSAACDGYEPVERREFRVIAPAGEIVEIEVTMTPIPEEPEQEPEEEFKEEPVEGPTKEDEPEQPEEKPAEEPKASEIVEESNSDAREKDASDSTVSVMVLAESESEQRKTQEFGTDGVVAGAGYSGIPAVKANVSGTWYWPFPGTTTANINGGYHDGIDVAVGLGAPIYAPQNGEIINAYSGCKQYGALGSTGPCKSRGICTPSHNFSEDVPDVDVRGYCNNGYGNGICLLTTDGVYVSFAHMNSAPCVAEGQYVTKGTLLGYAGGSGYATGVHCHYATSTSRWSGYFDPRDISYVYQMGGSRPPVGVVDADKFYSNTPGTIHIGGWAFDYDDTSVNLTLHVYVGAPSIAEGGKAYVVQCNGVSRTDVVNVYGDVGANHGFDLDIQVNESGTQPIYVYAIDVGSTFSDNTLINQDLINQGIRTLTIDPAIYVTKINLSETALYLAPGETADLTATPVPENATNRGIVWYEDYTTAWVRSKNGHMTAGGHPTGSEVTVGTYGGKAKVGNVGTITAENSASGVTAECKVYVVPGAPTELAASAASAGVTVSWTGYEGATRYQVWRSADGGTFQSQGFTSSLSFTDSSLEDGKSYSYKIQSYYNTWPGRTSESITYHYQQDPVKEYVKLCYRLLLGREGDADGVSYWVNQLKSGKQGGAAIVNSFVKSAEFKGFNLSNEETVKVIYRTMMTREADSAGLSYWKAFLDDGASPHFIVNGFSKSAEFKNLCSSYGINAGTITLTEYRDKNINVTRFVSRNYLYALNRRGDADGINYWCERIIKKTNTPQQCAQNFVFSKECVNRNLSNEEFVKMLYRLYMGREADAGGMSYWLGEMSKGMTRQKVANSFANSKEFKGIVAGYGL